MPRGRVVATDIAPELMEGIETANLEVRALDVVEDGLPENAYDLVLLRALLHHLPTRMNVIEDLAKALKPGGWVFIQEPDFYPTIVAEPSEAARVLAGVPRLVENPRYRLFIGRKGRSEILTTRPPQHLGGGSHAPLHRRLAVCPLVATQPGGRGRYHAAGRCRKARTTRRVHGAL